MEEIIIPEQDVVNAICLYLADKKGMAPENIQVELMYDDDYGFSAEAYVQGRKQVLVESNMIEAVRFWLDTEMQKDPFAASLRLLLDDEQGIVVAYRE
ncbi:YxcD family protein [Sporolactobacillus sp. CQH2019]|uniref:YxcD family protein n=1 Tax=Sporolactobacillus sp. CQH2019 TaxID=3023512 RepID=UPI0023687861|nr:YxcD family protein [Sporolactobacillus sp. CQH2019]MDD9148525.1 YxcD family protein [Sporolactobacillus sp. CQH2019]